MGRLVVAVGPDGTIRWTYVLPGKDQVNLAGPAVAANGVLYVPTNATATDMPGLFDAFRKNEPDLYALSPTGHLLWKYADAEPQCSPVIDPEDRIYLATDRPQLILLTSQGQVVQEWSVPAASSPSWVVLRQKGSGTWIYYLATDRSRLEKQRSILCLIRPDAPLRQITLPDLGAAVGLVLAERENALYACTTWENSSRLYQIDDTTLQVNWRFRLLAEVGAPPAVAKKGIYVGGRDSNLYAISHHGKLRWKIPPGGSLTMAPAVDSRGDIYLTLRSIKNSSHFLHCLQSNGKQRWQINLSAAYASLSAPIIGEQQTVYCYGDRAYAIADASQAP